MSPLFFDRTTVVFYGPRNFERKTTQADAKETALRRAAFSRERSLCETMKNHAKSRASIRNPLLYPAELRAHLIDKSV